MNKPPLIPFRPRKTAGGLALPWALLLLTLPGPSWARGADVSDAAPLDRSADQTQQTRQQITEQSGLRQERQKDQDARNLEALPRDRVQETNQQLQQQLLEQQRLTNEKRREQQVNRQDAFPKDKTLELRQQLRQQFGEQRQLSTERRSERAANLPAAPQEKAPPPPQNDSIYDAPR
ncbi:hypothetical protein [Methylogaea oryzae]|uniref:Uncharacterized protein n=1 Tax=Methylogaea oryzae TaxID=1295382 RepID=A0A8D5AK79_9GAMM|nr:hypothetical protein [Methylogaea oryzae]BBL71519.1 hypothetical protein MoryE10_21250 [Methylogaea oryzae]